MLTVAEVINGARQLDASFSTRNHADRVCIEFLVRFQRRLSGKILQVEPEAISDEISFTLPLDDFSTGVVLETGVAPDKVPLEWDRLHGFTLEDAEGLRDTLPVVPFKDRFTADRTLYGWIRENVLFLAGKAQDWVPWTAVVCAYAPTATGTLTTASTLILPNNALDVTVLALGAELAKRKPKDVERKTLPAEAIQAEEDYMNLMEERDDTTIGSVRRVFSI